MNKSNHPSRLELLSLYLQDRLTSEEKMDVEVQLLTNRDWQEALEFLKVAGLGARFHHLQSILAHLQAVERQLPSVNLNQPISFENIPSTEGYLATDAAYTAEREAESLEQPVEEEQPVIQGVRYHSMQRQLKHLQKLENQLPPVKVPASPTKLKHWSRALIVATVILLAGLFFPWSAKLKYRDFDRRFQPIDVPWEQHRSASLANRSVENSSLRQGLTWYIQGYYRKALREFSKAGLSVQDAQYGKYKIFAMLGAHKFKSARDSLLSIPPEQHSSDWYVQALKYLPEQ